jgi:ribosome-associated protein
MSKADAKRKRTEAETFGDLPLQIQQAAHAAQDKKALDLAVLDVRDVSSFTDYFVICSGQNARQVKAIADAVEEMLLKARTRPAHVEGYDRAEWVLLDYFDFIVHIFTPATREFYALERLWGSAERIAVPEPDARPGEAGR